MWAGLRVGGPRGDSGPAWPVVAIDKSTRFLDSLRSTGGELKNGNLVTHCLDLESAEFPAIHADFVWCRWVLSFVENPDEVLGKMTATLEPSGAIAMHEYVDYSTWRTMPPCPELDRFVSAVTATWRAERGEPDIALGLPRGLERRGMELTRVRPIVEATQPGEMLWAGLREFIRTGRKRLVQLGSLSGAEPESIRRELTRLEAEPEARMITPGVLEIVAFRRN
jgi:SAM-dependent methyltransferase